jgi:basic amino acid/polyamine antiporter, APA family
VSPVNPSPQEPKLERALGFLPAAALLTGTVIGTGIFLVPSTMARETGSVLGVLLVWLFGAGLSVCGALTYAELGAALPEAGGEYAFLRRAYGPFFGFLFGWQQIVIGKTGSIAAIGLASSLFLSFLFPVIERDILMLGALNVSGVQLVAIGWIILLTLPNLFGVAKGGALQTLLTFFKIIAILALVVVSLSYVGGSWERLFTEKGQPDPDFSQQWLGWGAALAAALWAYDGWNNVTMVSAEIRNPEKTIPRVLILGITTVAIIYMVTNLAYFYVLPLEAIQASKHVAQDVATQIFGNAGGQALTVTAVISTLAALNGAILSGARVFYAMARDGLFFGPLSRIDPNHHTPSRALATQATLAILLILLLGHDRAAFERVLDYALFGSWAFYGLTAFSVIILRIRQPGLHRPYRTIGYPWIPLAFTCVALIFCMNIGFRRPTETLMGLLFLGLGLPVYRFFQQESQGKKDISG